MRRIVLIAGSYLLFYCDYAVAQPQLNWGSSFTPPWPNGGLTGTATNINGYTVNCTTSVVMTGSGIFMPVMGGSGAQSPSVSGAIFTVPGATNKIQVTPNFHNNSSYVTITLNFSSLITNVSFRIADIDKADATSTTYFDKVAVTGSDGSNTFFPGISKYDSITDPGFLIISGHTAQVNTVSGSAGNTASDATDQRGTVLVSFGSAAINSISIRYDNAPGANNNPASQSIAIGNIGFSQYTLPARIVSLNGIWQQDDVLLNWTTSQEWLSSHFEVERSTGNSSWERIGLVTAAGQSNTDRHYQYRDMNPSGITFLYRLKQVDQNEQFYYSPILKMGRTATQEHLRTFPNPVSGQLNLSFESKTGGLVTLVLTDLIGRKMRTETRSTHTGSNTISMYSLENFPKGLYQLNLITPDGKLAGSCSIIKN